MKPEREIDTVLGLRPVGRADYVQGQSLLGIGAVPFNFRGLTLTPEIADSQSISDCGQSGSPMS